MLFDILTDPQLFAVEDYIFRNKLALKDFRSKISELNSDNDEDKKIIEIINNDFFKGDVEKFITFVESTCCEDTYIGIDCNIEFNLFTQYNVSNVEDFSNFDVESDLSTTVSECYNLSDRPNIKNMKQTEPVKIINFSSCERRPEQLIKFMLS